MPLLLNGIELLRYFRQPELAGGKSLQRIWQFYGFFIYNPLPGFTSSFRQGSVINPLNALKSDLKNKDFPPIIQPFHVLDVTVPTYKFQKKVMMYGQVPKSFPLLDFKGFDLKVTLEEDENGTVDYFITWLQKKIIDRKGYYNAPELMKIPAFVLEIQDKMGLPVVYYIFHDIYFLDASEVTYTYTSNDSVKRSLTFGCDRMSTIYTKQNVFAAGVAATVGITRGIKNSVKDKV